MEENNTPTKTKKTSRTKTHKKNTLSLVVKKESNPRQIRIPGEPYTRDVDNELMKEIRRADAHVELEDFRAAIEDYKKAIKILFEREKEYGRIHKGADFFFLGQLYLYTKDLQNSVKYIIAAFVEDVLSEHQESPAQGFLIDIFEVAESTLNEIKEKTQNIMKNLIEENSNLLKNQYNYLSSIAGIDDLVVQSTGELKKEFLDLVDNQLHLLEKNLRDKIPRAFDILENFLQEKGIEDATTLINAKIEIQLREKEFELQGTFKKRVFIGGSFILGPLSINIAKEVIEELKLIPIIADEFKMKEDEIHSKTIELLKNCEYAVFDITTAAGQYLEIERAGDFNIKILLIYGKRLENNIEVPPQITKMITSLAKEKEYKIIGFADKSQLKDILSDFLI